MRDSERSPLRRVKLVKRGIGIALLSICLTLVGARTVTPQAGTPQASTPPNSWAVIQQNCVGCHNSKTKAGGRAFDVMSPDNIAQDAETWEAAIRKLRGGLMPPAGAKRPDKQSVSELISWLETNIDKAAVKPDPGRVPLHRLNRREYEYAIRDLLGLHIDAEALLPADNTKGNFDNDAAALQVSPSFVDQYIYAARAVALEAVGNVEAPPVTTTYGDVANMVISLPPTGAPGEGRQQHHIEGMPLGTRGGFMVEHNFPADGEYELTIGDMALAREVPRMEFENTVIALLDGKEFYRTNIGGEADHKAIDQLLDSAVESINGRLRKIKFKTTAGQHKLAVTFMQRSFAESDERVRTVALEGGQERIQAVHALEIRGPFTVTGISDSPTRKMIFICKPAQPVKTSEETACARRILTNLAQRAFRRPVNDADLEGLMKFYQAGRTKEDFEHGVRDALSAILASPHFVFRVEETRSGAKAGESYAIADLDLASRLSFFLWAQPPDSTLIDLAKRGQLSNPATLQAQAQRMLADPRSEALATRFAAQWLRLQDVEKVHPDALQYPDFRQQLADDMRRETEVFFYQLVRENRSLLDLFSADYTYVNESLAKHYGMSNVNGPEFRRVNYPDGRRRGLLGQASILTLTSHANRTSPVLRGKWVMEVLLGSPPPPPPPNVPDLEKTGESKDGRLLSTRERMEQHRENPTCRSCHQYMDPIGLALDNFDVIGQWRVRENGAALDTRGQLYDGTPVSNLEDLQRALIKRPTPLIRTFTQNLMAYAIGRRIEYYDQPTIRRITSDAQPGGFRMNDFILGVVKSDAFRMARQASSDAGDR